MKHPACEEGQDQITRPSEGRSKGLSMYTHACLQRWGDWISEHIRGEGDNNNAKKEEKKVFNIPEAFLNYLYSVA